MTLGQQVDLKLVTVPGKRSDCRRVTVGTLSSALHFQDNFRLFEVFSRFNRGSHVRIRITRHITRPLLHTPDSLQRFCLLGCLQNTKNTLALTMLHPNSPFVEEPFPNFRWRTPVFQPIQPKLYCEFSLCASALPPKSNQSIVSFRSYQKETQKTSSIIPSHPIHPRRCNSQLIGRLEQPTNFLPIWLAG